MGSEVPESSLDVRHGPYCDWLDHHHLVKDRHLSLVNDGSLIVYSGYFMLNDGCWRLMEKNVIPSGFHE